MEKNKKILVSYQKIYDVEQKLYTIGNFRLPQPIQMHTAIALLIVALVMVIINNIINIPVSGLIKYGLVPYFIAKKITISKKDGKTLYKFYLSYIPYLFTKNERIERFKSCSKLKKIQFFK